jgi:Carboxypeptidase regulatory-like domain
MNRLLSVLIAGVIALPLLADETTKLQVRVTNLEGKPIDRASVVVKFLKGRSALKLGKKVYTHWETRTNQDGLAKVPELPQGQLLIQVIAKGYQTYGGTFEVNEEERTVEVKLNPPQPQYSAHE